MRIRIKEGKYKGEEGVVEGRIDDKLFVRLDKADDSPILGELIEVTVDIIEIISALRKVWRFFVNLFKKEK